MIQFIANDTWRCQLNPVSRILEAQHAEGEEISSHLSQPEARLLELLLRNANAPVERKHLTDFAWGGRPVAPGSLNHAIFNLRNAFGNREGQALLRFAGTLQVGNGESRRDFAIHRTAEVALDVVGDQVKSRTLSASRSYSDDAPDELVYRYAHPALEKGSHYHARLYRISQELIATGTDFAARNICALPPSA